MTQDQLPTVAPASDFCIKAGYQCRDNPEYFADVTAATTGVIHQPLVYDFAAFLTRRAGGKTIVDLGCGQAEKLLAVGEDIAITGVDYGENIRCCRERWSRGTWIELDFEERPFRYHMPQALRGSVVVSADVVEHLRNPVHLVASLSELLSAAAYVVITTPERDVGRAPTDMGPPGNAAHVREWSLEEFAAFLGLSGLDPTLTGLTLSNSLGPKRVTMVALVEGPRGGIPRPAGAAFTGTAYVRAYNEEDVIATTVRHLRMHGLNVEVIDTWSTDATVRRAEEAGAVVDRFPADGPGDVDESHAVLSEIERRSRQSRSDWSLFTAGEELRETPWHGVRLLDGFAHARRLGYDAVDFTRLNFRPVLGEPADSVEKMAYAEFGKDAADFSQITGWRRWDGPLTLAATAGHDAGIPDQRVYPIKFLARRYPVRGQAHGLRKMLDRRERSTDGRSGPEFRRSAAELLRYGPGFYRDYLIEAVSGVGAATATRPHDTPKWGPEA